MEDTPESKRQAAANDAVETAGLAKQKRKFPVAGMVWGLVAIFAFGTGHAIGAFKMADRTDGTVIVNGAKRNDGAVYQTF